MTTQQLFPKTPSTHSQAQHNSALKDHLMKAISNAREKISAASEALSEIENAVSSTDFQDPSLNIDGPFLFEDLAIDQPTAATQPTTRTVRAPTTGEDMSLAQGLPTTTRLVAPVLVRSTFCSVHPSTVPASAAPTPARRQNGIVRSATGSFSVVSDEPAHPSPYHQNGLSMSATNPRGPNPRTANVRTPKRDNSPWYTVVRGRKTGVFRQYALVQQYTDGFRGNCFRGYATEALAYQAYLEALDDKLVSTQELGPNQQLEY